MHYFVSTGTSGRLNELVGLLNCWVNLYYLLGTFSLWERSMNQHTVRTMPFHHASP